MSDRQLAHSEEGQSCFRGGAAQRIVVKRAVDGALWPVRLNFETFYRAASLLERISSGINPSPISKKHKASWREDLWKRLLWFTEPGWWAELLWSGWRGGDSGCCRRTLPFLALASETHMTATSKHGWERRHSHSQRINKKSAQCIWNGCSSGTRQTTDQFYEWTLQSPLL